MGYQTMGMTLLQGWQLMSCRVQVLYLSDLFSLTIDCLYLLTASSTDIERGFSRGGLTVTKLHHNLSDESTRAATVVHSWSNIKGLIPEQDIIKLFQDKSKRQKGSSESSDANTIDVI